MRIIVADDHPLYREAVARQVERLFPQAQVQEVSTLDEARARAGAEPPDLFIVDYYMPGMSGENLAAMRADFPAVPILVLSGWASSTDVLAMIRAGARGYLPKTATPEQFAHALQMLLAGGTSIPADILMAGKEDNDTNGAAAPWFDALTPREREVLRATARGLSNKEIGRELNLAEVTIKLHLRAIFRKTGARSRTEAAMLASKAGIL